MDPCCIAPGSLDKRRNAHKPFSGWLSSSNGPTTTAGLALGFFTAGVAFALDYRRQASIGAVLRSWWFEPMVATLSFAVAIDVYDRRERKMGCQPRGGCSGFAAVSYWFGIMLWSQAVAPPSDIVDVSGGTAYLVLEVASGVVAYDCIFFFVHWFMHIAHARLHQTHHSHSASELRARDVLTHSVLDGVLQVLTNIAVQRTTPWGATKSRVARALHNVIMTWALTESHTCSPSPRIARCWCAGVARHREHHGGAPYYQQIFGFLDDLRLHVACKSKSELLTELAQASISPHGTLARPDATEAARVDVD